MSKVKPFYRWVKIETGLEHYLDAQNKTKGHIYHSMGGNWCFSGPFLRGQTPLKRDAKRNVEAQMGIPLNTDPTDALGIMMKKMKIWDEKKKAK